jgi:hypothetical protein
MIDVSDEQIALCKRESTIREDIPCDMDVYHLGVLYMTERSWPEPKNLEDALALYRKLRRIFYEDLFDE